jgi:transmembrane sensor
MNNYIDMNDVEQLIIDKLTGHIGEEDDLRLSDLIARHQEVEQLWQQMQQVYAMRRAVSFEQSFNVPEPVTDTVAIPEPRMRGRSNTHRLRYGIAAAVTGIIIISLIFFGDMFRSHESVAKGIQIKLANGSMIHASAHDSLAGWMENARNAHIDPGAWNTLQVPAGKSYSFQLGDGSKVSMNAVSELRFPLLFTQSERIVALKGEAYFKIAHRSSQPFKVQVNGLTVKALGTEFNIKSYNGESTYISLVNGSVSVENAKGESIILLPGEAVVAENSNSPLSKESFDETLVLGWMQGLYYFRNEKLQHIAVVAERWFDINVQIKDPSLFALHFSGALDRNKPVDAFFNMLASSGDIHYKNEKGKITITRN